MNCAYHNDHLVEGVCSSCGRPICGECLVDLSGTVYCKPCLESRMKSSPRQVSGFARFVLSVMPGLGHLFMGLANRGLQLMVGTVLGAAILTMMAPRAPWGFFVVVGAIFFSIFDAREAHLRMEQGLAVEDRGFVDLSQLKLGWNNRYVGYALVGLGILVLYNNFLSDLLGIFLDSRVHRQVLSSIRGMTMGVIAIGAGIYMLRGGPGKNASK